MHASALVGTFSHVADGLRATVRLNNGVAMPWLGLGVYGITVHADMQVAVQRAVDFGYRSFDTAAIYQNEGSVGEALRTSGVPREELFVTTKVWNDAMRADLVEGALTDSLKRLKLDYIDLYLLHWPIQGKLTSSWRVLEKLQRSGLVRAIGVSNFMISHLDELLAAAEIVPAVNQIEYHPYLQSRQLIEFCKIRDIQIEAWSPLMQGRAVLQNPVLVKIAARHNKTVAQVILRWNVQSGVVTIPKTSKPDRIEENARIFDFNLTVDQMTAIAALDRNERVGPDPLNFNF